MDASIKNSPKTHGPDIDVRVPVRVVETRVTVTVDGVGPRVLERDSRVSTTTSRIDVERPVS